MINKTELRIGNKVLLGNDIVTVKEIGEFELSFDDGKFLFTYDRFKPIELSPAILEACGFEKDGFNAYNISISAWPDTHLKQLSFAGDYLYLREGDLRVNRIKDNICVLWNNDLSDKMHLHQLQNLYFALTGTELSVNLEKVKV